MHQATTWYNTAKQAASAVTLPAHRRCQHKCIYVSQQTPKQLTGWQPFLLLPPTAVTLSRPIVCQIESTVRPTEILEHEDSLQAAVRALVPLS